MQPPQVVKIADVKIGIGGLVAVAGGGWALCEVSRPLSNETTCTGGKISTAKIITLFTLVEMNNVKTFEGQHQMQYNLETL